MKVIMMIIIVILVILEIKITTIVMMMRIKMIEENGIGRRGVYFKWRSSQKFCKDDGFKRQNQSYTQERRFEQRSFKKCLPGTQQWERD